MRLAGQARGGYYAAPPEAVAAALGRLRPPETGPCVAFDPCAGEAAAIKQIADALEAEPYAVELSEDRARVVRELLGEENVLAPANFLGTSISPKWVSFAWVNPPFDDKLGGGGRVELDFVERVIPMLAPHGVLALVCPESVAEQHQTMALLSEQFEVDTMSALPP